MKLHKSIQRFFRYLSTPARRGPVSEDEKMRLQHFTVFLSLGIPTMLAYGAYNLAQASYLLSTLVGLSAAGLVVGWYLLRKTESGAIVYRVNIVLFGCLILYMVVLGGTNGSMILWMYTCPLIACFLMGKNEGLIWSIGVFAVALFFLVVPFGREVSYAYPTAFTVRFVTTYLIVTAVTYWFEYFRFSYRTGMEAERCKLEQEQLKLKAEIVERRRAETEKEQLIQQLRVALKKVKTLRGLIPICANCHRIRDDQGYWNQLEAYIREHSNAEFSHSICPECSEQYYPDLAVKEKEPVP